MTLKKLILPLVVYLIGFGVTIIAALFKMMHWPYGAELLIFGMLFQALGVLITIIILIKLYFKKE
ncbi:hypothetical protein [Lacinutrix sp. MedPE-SW]|uniref:GldL-related protein n=1 Tax=Lacinutrix sp. MedPE-SW TaxID=1860087 RepID=UPI00091D842D|nr:hypothetical protein [Lacinutrix sp. MedPE-SW]OIQ22669.1 MAG: hypothetical protein BM549_06205 [Lacinutrix sp. MedPE-SW]